MCAVRELWEALQKIGNLREFSILFKKNEKY